MTPCPQPDPVRGDGSSGELFAEPRRDRAEALGVDGTVEGEPYLPADPPGGAVLDMEAVLRRVVADVLPDFRAAYATAPRDRHFHRATLSGGVEGRRIALMCSCEWFELAVDDLDVSTVQFEYDGDEAAKEEMLRSLARAAGNYLRGEGRVQHGRGLFRRRPRLTITVDGTDLVLSRPLFRWERRG